MENNKTKCPMCDIPLSYDPKIGLYCIKCGFNHKPESDDPKPVATRQWLTTIIIFFISITSLFGQIEFDGSIELGAIDDRLSLMEGNYLRTYKDGIVPYSNVLLEFSIRRLIFEQSIGTTFTYEEGYTFKPLEIKYISSLHYDLDRLSLGASHMCLHPIIDQTQDVYDGAIKNIRRQSFTKIYLKFYFKKQVP